MNHIIGLIVPGFPLLFTLANIGGVALPRQPEAVRVQKMAHLIEGFLQMPDLSVILSQNWLSLLSLMVAVGAAWMAYHYRREMLRIAVSSTGKLRETVTRVSSPVASEVGAYLEVVAGDEMLTGKLIPIYPATATSAGRSVEQAELVFNLNHDYSVVSRLHCEFCEERGVFRVRDLGSTQGSYVNGTRLPAGGEGQILLDGDMVELGPAERGGVVLRFLSSAVKYNGRYKS